MLKNVPCDVLEDCEVEEPVELLLSLIPVVLFDEFPVFVELLVTCVAAV